MRGPVEVRVWRKLRQEDECWVWTGSKSNGYGTLRDGEKTVKAFHVTYAILVGEVPEGLQRDHTCRNRACCNPYHIDLVPQRVNIMRGENVTAHNAVKTRCKWGHEFTAENTRLYVDRAGRTGRICKACKRRDRNVARNRRVAERR